MQPFSLHARCTRQVVGCRSLPVANCRSRPVSKPVRATPDVPSSNAPPARYNTPSTTHNITWHDGGVPSSAKEAALGQRGCVVWLTGLSGAGKSTVACALECALARCGVATALLDGDNIRHGLCADLGFSEPDRAENVRRVGEVAALMAEAGLVVLAALVSPYAAHRETVRARLPSGRFVEVYVDAPLAVCQERDPKRLYAAARAGKLAGLTGVDAPYEPPAAAEVTLRADGRASPAALANVVLAHMQASGLVPAGTGRASVGQSMAPFATSSMGTVVPLPATTSGQRSSRLPFDDYAI